MEKVIDFLCPLQKKAAHESLDRQAGNIIFTLFAAVAMVGLVGVGAMTAVKGPSRLINQVTQKTIAENDMIGAGKMALTSIVNQPSGGDCDGDGMPEAPAWIAATGGKPFPTGGGLLPPNLGAAQMDVWKTHYGYCVWDHGTARRSGACPSDNRLEGEADGSGIVVAIISAGPDKIFQTSCANAAGGYVIHDDSSDDIVLTHNFAEAKSIGGELWNLKTSDTSVAEIGKSLEIKDTGGAVTAAIHNETGIGEFNVLSTGTISGKSGTAVEIDGALKLANETLATDAACIAGTQGTLRYHATNGMQICNGTAYVPVTGVGGGYNYNGLFEGKISAGGWYTCALRTDGAAYCWGAGASGKLGNGTTTDTIKPVAVAGGHKFVQISAASQHACALRTDGAAYCWGNNSKGYLGNGTTTSSSIPVAVAGGHKFVQIVTGFEYSCGLRSDGAAYCWGTGASGKLGDGTTADKSSPVAVIGGHKFTQLSGLGATNCGLTSDGSAYCWGAGDALGDGTTTNKSSPVAVIGGHKFARIFVGNASVCALRKDGAAYCWGSNGAGQLGDGTTTNRTSPVAVLSDYKFTQINIGLNHACGIEKSGTTYCWGSNLNGRLGNGTTTNSLTPVAVSGGHKFVQITVNEYVCGLESSGSVYCWGSNTFSRLGDGTITQREIPTHVLGFSMVDVQNRPYQFIQDPIACGADRAGTVQYHPTNGMQLCDGATYGPVSPVIQGQYDYSGFFEGRVSAGYDHVCALRSDGAAYCWGRNTEGQLGDGTTIEKGIPTPVSGGFRFSQIESGDTHTCGLRVDGVAMCWGENLEGRLGDGTTTNRTAPVAVSGGHKFIKVFASEQHSCGIKDDGAAYCWGWGALGQLGRGSNANSSVPVAVSGGYKFSHFASGGSLNCGVLENGAAYCWGYNNVGQLGNGTTSNSNIPVAVQGSKIFKKIYVGYEHACGFDFAGKAWCWGSNGYGRLGDGTTTDRPLPTAVAGNHSFRDMDINYRHGCGIRLDGTLWCWGNNSNGQLGDNTSTQRNMPVPVLASANYAKVSIGAYHTCGLRSDGEVYCWGANWSKQLGNGTTSASSIPLHVAGISMADYQNRSFQFGDDKSSCTWDNVGAMRYTGGTPKYDYCNGTAWVAFPAATVSLPWKQISIGIGHVCGIRSDGAAYCWGENGSGQLGDGTYVNSTNPKLVAGGHVFTQIDTSLNTSCGLKDNGDIYCWGTNITNTINSISPYRNNIPTLLGGGHKYVQVALSMQTNSSCGLRQDGAAYCWGSNDSGQLGDGTNINRALPVAVVGGQKFKQLSGGTGRMCGLSDNGDAYCWGYDGPGALGQGDDMYTGPTNIPLLVTGGHKYTFVNGSREGTWALKDDGDAYAIFGTPHIYAPGYKYTQISAGGWHFCGLSEGKAYCLGDNAYGQLGDGTKTNRIVPTLVTGGLNFVSIVAGYEVDSYAVTCGIVSSGDAYCWGSNAQGQLGNGTYTDSSVPVRVIVP